MKYKSSFLEREINRLYFTGCGHPECVQLNMPAPVLLSWQQVYANLEQLYSDVAGGRLAPENLNEDFVTAYVNDLSKPFKERLSSNFDAPDYTEPNYNFIRQVHGNLFQFAGAKTYRELKELNDLLTKNGKLVPFSEFRRDAEQYRAKVQGVREKYRSTWLEAEYTHAVRTSQMADRWQGFEENRDLYPNLIYLTAGDERVRESHRALHKVIRSIDDPFWDKYYPPNGWRCRCRVEPTRQAPTTKAPPIDIPGMFKNNPAKTGNVFPETHPYYSKYEALKERIRSRSAGFADQAHTDRQRKTFEAYRGKDNYEPVNFNAETGGYVVRHRKHAKPDSSQQSIINALVNQGDAVVLPESTGLPGTKSPELIVNGARFGLDTADGSRSSVRDRVLEVSQRSRFSIVDLRKLNTAEVAAGITDALKKLPKDQTGGIMLVHGSKRVYLDRAALNRPKELKQAIAQLQ